MAGYNKTTRRFKHFEEAWQVLVIQIYHFYFEQPTFFEEKR
jgi:hypothetical protein